MTARPRLPLEGQQATTTGPHAAGRAVPQAAVGARRVVAEGVPSSLRPNPPQGDGRYPVAWLRITAPRGAVPTATSTCLCGRDRSAVGHGKVLALLADHEAHRDLCPLRTPQEGRAAA
ncbi:hypothetical protein AB0L75_09080 [Streptomyces sp. NPDC052101]|uniref:hypothetical protein n=1 Tax=Streptomyces sp. NPDC052101 TaxID=3155763 RepID=UPI0034434498